ncbi:MAG: sialate O-acetylesterase, partial [Planctomycetota bacterium]
RRAWNQPDLPHYYVQIAPFQYGDEDPTILPRFWEAQAAIEKEIPHTGMVVIHDVGNIEDIHPRNKQAVGHRLAFLALGETYGRDVVAGGPRFEKMTIEGDKVRVFFDRTGTGLVTSDGQEPNFFEIAGESGMFVPAKARIDGPTVVLSAPDVRKPCAIRYAWSKLAEPHGQNWPNLT